MSSRSFFAMLTAIALTLALPTLAEANHRPPENGRSHEYGEMVDYRLIFPVDGDNWFSDTFWACRGSPCGYHHAQDLMAPKMTPVVAAATGTIRYVNWSSDPENLNPDRCCTLVIDHDDGWRSTYIHLNNDTPGTDDGQGWGIADGIVPGVRVTAGQLVGWVGDSGNAESTDPHLHFELTDTDDTYVNSYEALVGAEGSAHPTCDGLPATHWDADGDGNIKGTTGDDVIAGGPGAEKIRGRGGNDIICGGDGDDEILAGRGADRVFPGPGADVVHGGGGKDWIFAGEGTATIDGGRGRDQVDYRNAPQGVIIDLTGAGGDDLILAVEHAKGSPFDDVLVGNADRNRLSGRAGSDLLEGQDGPDILRGQRGDDEANGGEGDDLCRAEISNNCER